MSTGEQRKPRTQNSQETKHGFPCRLRYALSKRMQNSCLESGRIGEPPLGGNCLSYAGGRPAKRPAGGSEIVPSACLGWCHLSLGLVQNSAFPIPSHPRMCVSNSHQCIYTLFTFFCSSCCGRRCPALGKQRASNRHDDVVFFSFHSFRDKNEGLTMVSKPTTPSSANHR